MNNNRFILLGLYIITLSFFSCNSNVTQENKNEPVVICDSIINLNEDCDSSLFDTITNRFVYSVVDKMPEFPGGEIEFHRYLFNNFEYPQLQTEMQTTFNLQYVVDIDGKMIGERITKKTNWQLTLAERELLNCVKRISNKYKYKPGTLNGKLVPVLITHSIKIELNR